jgi:hypothetical protein
MVQDHLAGAHVVKAFNHIPAAAILTDGAPAAPRSPRSRDRERPCGCRSPRDRRLRRVRLRHRRHRIGRRELARRARPARLRRPPGRRRAAREPGPRDALRHVLSARRSRPRCRRSRPSAAALAA